MNMRTKANRDNVNDSVKSSNKSIAKWIIGGITLGLLGWATYKVFIKPRKVAKDENSVDSQSDVSADIDNEDITHEPDYVTRSGFMREFIEAFNDEPLFGPNDISILDYDDSDRDVIDQNTYELRDNFISVNYVEAGSSSDGYAEINIKIDNVLKRKTNRNDKSDDLINSIKMLIQEVKDLDDDFRPIRFSVKSLCFHPKTEDGDDVTISQLRDLREVEGVRYINIRLFRCESEDGIDFIVRLLKLFHPEGGEEGNEIDLMPVIVITEGGRMSMPKRNNLAEVYMGINNDRV